eukprot:COSAG06_NODE_29807_length_550_cov_0.802661_1_plen_44_part_10
MLPLQVAASVVMGEPDSDDGLSGEQSTARCMDSPWTHSQRAVQT